MSRRLRRTYSAAFKAKVAPAAVRGDKTLAELAQRHDGIPAQAYESVSQARSGIGRSIEFYNTRRPHSILGAETPDMVYLRTLPWPAAKAA